MRIVFMGTPDFAVAALEALHEAGHRIVGVYTRMDTPKNRGMKLLPPPVKVKALEYGIPVFQPKNLRGEDTQRQLRELEPEVIVVAAYGRLLPQAVLDIPRYGCLNIHASLLPKYRGASPINACILHGETEAGVTIMQMDAGLDTGDMLLKDKVAITPDMTTEELHDKLMDMGGRLLSDTIDGLAAGTIVPEKQDDSLSNYAGMLNKETGHIDWTKTATEIHNLIRGLNSWPVAWGMLEGKNYKFWRTRAAEGDCSQPPGTVTELGKNSFKVATGKGLLEVLELQPPSRKRMSAGDFVRGHGVEIGAVFS